MPSASAASAGPKRPPPVDDACGTTDDCDVVFDDETCCHQCEPRFGNKSWKRDVQAICRVPANVDARCDRGPQGCSVGFYPPRCLDGHCKSVPKPRTLGWRCTTDADCALTDMGDDCCRHCEERVGNKSAINSLVDDCTAQKPPPRCEPVACSVPTKAPTCENQRCVVR